MKKPFLAKKTMNAALFFYTHFDHSTADVNILVPTQLDSETSHFIAGFNFKVRLVFVVLLGFSLICASVSAVLVIRSVFKVTFPYLGASRNEKPFCYHAFGPSKTVGF